jgi:hypothetical protein
MRRCVAGACVVICLLLCSHPAFSYDLLPPPAIQILGPNLEWLCMLPPYEGILYDVYVWVNPDTAGVRCAEYMVVISPDPAPYELTLVSVTGNPICLTPEGNPLEDPGTVICSPDCQREIFWTHKLTFLPLSGHAYAMMDIAPHGESAEVRAVSCTEPDRPYISLRYYAWDWTTGIGGVCPGIEETSWGAIKSMYR